MNKKIRLDILIAFLEWLNRPKPIHICHCTSTTYIDCVIIFDGDDFHTSPDRVIYSLKNREIEFISSGWTTWLQEFFDKGEAYKLFKIEIPNMRFQIPEVEWFPQKSVQAAQENVFHDRAMLDWKNWQEKFST